MIRRHAALISALVVIAILIWFADSLNPRRQSFSGDAPIIATPTSTAVTAAKNMRYPRAREFVNPSGFINHDPFQLADLIGKKVILIDFWTYTCINCQRTEPFLKAWYAKYRDQGLEIVGVHTPEFAFEKIYDNVKRAVDEAGVTYPVVQDNDFGIWNAYGNHYWPHVYLIDTDGYVVYDHIGEGGYDDTEHAIQAALTEKMTRDHVAGTVATTLVTTTEAIIAAESPETYFGAARNQYLSNGNNSTPGQQILTAPHTVNPDSLYLIGTWNFTDEYAENSTKGAGVAYRYQAASMYFVASAPKPVRIKVYEDGQSIQKSRAGADVRYDKTGQSYITVQEDRLYKLIETGAPGEHLLELEIESPGLKAFTFTFG